MPSVSKQLLAASVWGSRYPIRSLRLEITDPVPSARHPVDMSWCHVKQEKWQEKWYLAWSICQAQIWDSPLDTGQGDRQEGRLSLLSSANMDFSESLCKGVTQIKTYKLAEFGSTELNGRFKAKDWINPEVVLPQTQWIQCADAFWSFFSIKQN